MTQTTWKLTVNGPWTSPTGWTNNDIPQNGYDVYINRTGTYTVTIGSSTATNSIDSLTLNNASATLSIVGGSLNVNYSGGTDTLTLTAGTLSLTGGSVTATNGISFGGSSAALSGYGTVAGALSEASGATSSGIITASGGVLDLTSNAASPSTGQPALTFDVASTASSVLEFDGSVGSGNTVTFLGANATALALGNLAGFAATVSGLQVETGGATTVSAANYLNVQGSAITGITVGDGTTGNEFTGVNATATTINIYDGVTLLDTISLAAAPAAGTFVDYGAAGGITGSGITSGTDIFLDNAVCFAEGTRILTARGEVPVEQLAEDDLIVTLAGEQYPLKWLGCRRLDLSRHAMPELAAPVRIRRHAFGEDLPRRDLVVSPDHSLLVDDKLIPAKLLINGMTIVQDRDVRCVTYYHVELERHAVLLAEGLPAESYLDTGNRAFFDNAGLALVLHPDFAINAHLKCWEFDACAPLTIDRATVEPIWQRLAQRAGLLGYRRPCFVLSQDPELRLVADGRVLHPLSTRDNRYVFALPAGTSSVRLTSRATVPSFLAAYANDWRRLGVAIRRIVVRDHAGLIEIPPDHPGLTQGWYRVERDDATTWRWMDGNAVVPVATTDCPATVEIQVGMTMHHRVADGLPGVADAVPVSLAA